MFSLVFVRPPFSKVLAHSYLRVSPAAWARRSRAFKASNPKWVSDGEEAAAVGAGEMENLPFGWQELWNEKEQHVYW